MMKYICCNCGHKFDESYYERTPFEDLACCPKCSWPGITELTYCEESCTEVCCDHREAYVYITQDSDGNILGVYRKYPLNDDNEEKKGLLILRMKVVDND